MYSKTLPSSDEPRAFASPILLLPPTVGKKVNKKAATATSKYWLRELNKLNQETLGKKTFASIKRFAKQAALAAQKIKNKKARSAPKKPAGKKTK